MSVETSAHRRLKQLALAFLRQRGCLILASEVRCPQSKYRVDAAGYQDRMPANSRGAAEAHKAWKHCPARAIVIECKQSRPDFLRDNQRTHRLLAFRDRLERIRRSIEQHRISVAEPHLRRSGSALFAALEQWDFAASRLPAYRRVLRKLRRLHEQLHGQTKFFLMARYVLADELYIAAPRGMVRTTELPSGWGLLECSPSQLRRRARGVDLCQSGGLVVRTPAPDQATRDAVRTRWLRNIAVAACNALGRTDPVAAATRVQQPILPFQPPDVQDDQLEMTSSRSRTSTALSALRSAAHGA